MKGRSKSEGLKGRSGFKLKVIVLGIISFSILSLLIFLRYGIYLFGREFFPVKKVVFIGNRHVSEKELMILFGISIDSSRVDHGLKSIKANLLRSPWVKDAIIRREFPDRIKIKIVETSPLAILEMKGKPFLIDEEGKLIEEMHGEAIPFLPVILSDPFKNKTCFTEAIKLARILREWNIAKERNRVEILADRDKENISVIIDGIVIKVGYGNYNEKLERLFELEDEIRKRAMVVEYIDLRFSDHVVVKPVKEVVK